MKTVSKKLKRFVVLAIARHLAAWMDRRERELYDPFVPDDERGYAKIRRACLAQTYFNPQWEYRDPRFGHGWTEYPPFNTQRRMFVLAAAPKHNLP